MMQVKKRKWKQQQNNNKAKTTTDQTGKNNTLVVLIILCPFKKFFNINETEETSIEHITDLINNGVKTVDVSKSGLTVKPIVPGLQKAKLNDTNWISRLAFKELKDTLTTAMANGYVSPISSTDPITPYIIGGEDDAFIDHKGFGEGENGKY